MDFLALPRRDLQALCKRNGVRANMTNAAMADALRALPTIDGIEEYVKQQVAVPEQAVKEVAEEDQKKLEKQGSPLPRGRRATVKSSEPIKPDKSKEEDKGDAKRQSNKEDAPALGVGRRGASRCARAEPVVPQPAAKANEEEGNPLAEGDEDPKREAKRENAPAAVVARRGASRRAPAVVAAAGKLVAEEEQRAPIPRGRRVKAMPTEPIRLDENDEDECEDVEPEDKQEDAPILGVGRCGGSRRARAALAVAAPAGKAEEERKTPIPRGCHAKAKPTEIIRLDDSEEEKENMKPEKEEGAPAMAVGRRGASRRAPARAPGTKRTAAPSATETGDVARKAVPIRATRQRKPTMKAAALAAAAQEAPRRATRRGAVRKTHLHQEEQEESQEVVPAPVSGQGCDPEYSEEATEPQNQELTEVVEASPKQEDEVVEIIVDEKLMEENPAEEPLVTDQEYLDKPTVQTQQVNVEKYPAPLASQEDSPILGLVSTATTEIAGDDEGAKFQASVGSNAGVLGNRVCKEVHDADEKMEIVPVVQVMQDALPDEESNEDIADQVNHKHEKEISEFDTEDDLVSQEKEDMDIEDLQAALVHDEAIILDCSGNISQVAGEETNEVNTEYGLGCQEKEDVVVDKVLPDMVDKANNLEVKKAGDITSEMPDNPAALDEDGEETIFYASICDGHKPNEVVIGDSVSQITVTDGAAVEEKAALIRVKMPQGTAAMHDNIDEDQLEAVFVHADQVKMTDAGNLPEVKISDCEIVEEEHKPLIVDEKQQSTAAMDDDAVDGHFITDVVHANEQMEVMTTDKVPELTRTIDGGVVVDDLKNDVAHSDEQKEVTSTDGEVVEEKATVITEEMPNITDTMDECVMENYFCLHSEQKKEFSSDIVPEVSRTENGSRKENAFTNYLPQEFHVAEDSNGHITPALLDVTESFYKSSVIVEPQVFVAGDSSMCKNSSEKNTTEPVTVQNEEGVKVVKKSVDLSKLSLGNLRAEHRNTTEPVATQKEKGVKVAKKPVDLSKLSLGQLRAELKKKLNANKEKEAKRVALARVDENICRSHAKGQQQNLNLQQH